MKLLLLLLALVALCVCLTGCDKETLSSTTNMVDPYGPAEL
jgi:hypothetical protein